MNRIEALIKSLKPDDDNYVKNLGKFRKEVELKAIELKKRKNEEDEALWNKTWNSGDEVRDLNKSIAKIGGYWE